MGNSLSYQRALWLYIQDCLNFLNDANLRGELRALPTNQKGLLICSLYCLSNEHCLASSKLMVERKFSSALALIRPALEAVIRGLWMDLCVDDGEKIEKLMCSDNLSEWKKINHLIQEIHKASDTEIFSRYQGKAIGQLSGFTHGTASQLGLISNNGNIGFKMSYEQIAIVNYELCEISCIANMGICSLGKKSFDLQVLLEKIQVIRDKYVEFDFEERVDNQTYAIEFLK